MQAPATRKLSVMLPIFCAHHVTLAGLKRWDMVDLLKQLSGAALEDNNTDLVSLAQYARAGRTNTQEQQVERQREAHRIFDVQVSSQTWPALCIATTM